MLLAARACKHSVQAGPPSEFLDIRGWRTISRTGETVTSPDPARLVRVVVATVLGVLCLSIPTGLRAQATTTVPGDHPAYRELGVLRAEGWIRETVTGHRPHSRLEFARMVSEARSRVDSVVGLAHATPPPGAREREALARLEAWFEEELERLCVLEEEPAPGCGVSGVDVRPRLARADLTHLQSPWRSIPTLYDLPADFIDGRLNPLVEGSLGRRYVDGWTGALEGGAELQLGSSLVVYVHPRLSVARPRGAGSDTDPTVHQLYLRSVVGNVALEVGRNHLYFGQGLESGTVVSQNPRGLDMIRVSNDRPFRFPWFLEGLGPAGLSFVAADLGSDRDIPHALLFVAKGTIRPHPNLELGLTSLNVQGGDGAPTGPFWERVADVLVPGVALPEFSEKLAGVEARLTLPDPGVEFYVEFTNTDPDFRRFGQAVTHEAAWLVGAAMHSFGPEGRIFARAEWLRNGFRPYTHHQYTSGLTLDGLVIGSPLGPAATGVSGQVGWSGTAHQIRLDADWERYHADVYANIPDPETGRLSWERIAENPDEDRFRLVGEWSCLAAGVGFQPSGRVGWETVDRFAWGDRGRTNWLFAATLAYRW